MMALRKADDASSTLDSLQYVMGFRKARDLMDYTSFEHQFAMGIGPEGVIIWQALDTDECKSVKFLT